MNNTTRIALVTGATRGIGLETVRGLAVAGVHALLAGRDPRRTEEAAQRLRDAGLPVTALVLDVTDTASIEAAVATVEAGHGRLDILVNNAGIAIDDRTLSRAAQPIEVWRRTFDTNLFGVVAVTQAFLPLLRRSPSPRIVNVSSALASFGLHADPAAPLGAFALPAYNASKSALNAWTLQLAQELRDTGIKVNAVHPGYVRTDMNNGGGDLGVDEGAASSVAMALVGDDGPTASFTHRGEVLPW